MIHEIDKMGWLGMGWMESAVSQFAAADTYYFHCNHLSFLLFFIVQLFLVLVGWLGREC